jgi:AraC family transcriptional regulator of adaptative response/methylated-DNA-[protein]-cysteine methyltransferase
MMRPLDPANRLTLVPDASRSGWITVLNPTIRCSGAKPLLLAKTGLHPLIGLRLVTGLGYVPGMSLDFAECDRARVARDPKYDGRFYTGVRTTGIYCRPVCPVRPARSVNVTFFPSAAAAEAAGFRPCLRCRPETAPFSSAWIGSRATVVRAMRLILEDGALDQDGATVEHLAARLGMGSRQLRRLFARHLQASPSLLARTARVQRAKRLIDETGVSMTQIAIQAGFGSLRRFNSVFTEVYGRAPTQIRRKTPS